MDGVISSGVRNEDEGLYPIQHGHWLKTMQAAIEKRTGASAATTRS
jgi:benzoate/toluate 1,2-dioxygenase alpha subunit